MAAPAAKLLIDIAANVAGIKKDFGEASSVIQGFGNTVKTVLAGLGIGASVQGILKLVDAVGALGEAADRVGLDTTTFQALTAALRDAGVAAENVGSLLGKGAKFLGAAFEGNKENIDRLRQLGVGLIDAKGNAVTYAEALPQIAKGLLAIENPMQRASMAAAFFGKAGKDLIPALEAMAKGTDALRNAYSKEIIPAETIRRFDEFSDALAGLKVEVIAKVAEGINEAFNADNVKAIKAATDAWKDFAKALENFGGGGGGGASDFWKPLQEKIAATSRELEGLARVGERVVRALDRIKEQAFPPEEKARRATIAQQAGFEQDEAGSRVQQLPAVGPVATRLPEAKGSVDKYSEALKKLQAEIDATNAGIAVLAAGVGQPSKEIERQAKATAEAGVKLSAMLKDIPLGTDTTKIKEKNEELKRQKLLMDQTLQTIATATEVSSKYGDGQRELADRQFYLSKAYASNRITLAEYTAAMDEANKTAEKQKYISEGLQNGIGGLAAGFKYAAAQMSESQTDFQLGQQLFTDSFQLMSSSISEFVKNGTLDFGKLAESFASMLANMAAQWAAAAILRSILGSPGGGIDSEIAGWSKYGTSQQGAGGGILGFIGSALGSMFAGGMKAGGGDVLPGHVYTVGEGGPEKFVPAVPGTIIPNGGQAGDVTVNVAMGGGGQKQDAKTTLEFARKVKAAVVDVITNEKRPGGILYAR